MPCYHPLPCWYSGKRNENGKRSIVFGHGAGTHGKLSVPCGTCVGCKLEKARQWSVRCMHEASLYDVNCFVTLTYRELPPGGSLVPKHFVDFMKRLRFHYGEVRFFQCGEYGEALSRPHHHALFFGLDFPDKRAHGGSGENQTYISESLDSMWSHGNCVIGSATFESAGYIARYALKKVVGEKAGDWYQGRVPEYLTMSRRPGIGAGFVKQYKSGIYRDDSVIVRGAECKPPRYYDNVMEKLSPSVMKRVKARRRAAAEDSEDNSGKRLLVREEVKRGAIANLSRKLEV